MFQCHAHQPGPADHQCYNILSCRTARHKIPHFTPYKATMHWPYGEHKNEHFIYSFVRSWAAFQVEKYFPAISRIKPGGSESKLAASPGDVAILLTDSSSVSSVHWVIIIMAGNVNSIVTLGSSHLTNWTLSHKDEEMQSFIESSLYHCNSEFISLLFQLKNLKIVHQSSGKLKMSNFPQYWWLPDGPCVFSSAT